MAQEPSAPADAATSSSSAAPAPTLPPTSAPSAGLELAPQVTDLSSFYQFVSLDRVVPGNFTKVRKLKPSIHGGVYLYKWEHDGQELPVVIKVMSTENVNGNDGKETCEVCAHLASGARHRPESTFQPCTADRIPHQEDAKTEIGVITYLTRQADCPRYLLRMIDSFIVEDKTWLITEQIEGGEFFDQVATQAIPLSEDRTCRYMWQLLHAVRYLHCHAIGHRDISLENILITFRRDPPGQKLGEFRLMDFGGACRTHRGHELLRYFRPVGKAYYRAPECYLPFELDTKVMVPKDAAGSVVFAKLADPRHQGYVCEVKIPPEAIPERLCQVELAGYTVPSMDIFACGVCMFIMSWGLPPWQRAQLADQLFQFSCNNGLPELLNQWRKAHLSPQGMAVLVAMCKPVPAMRPSIERLLASELFRDMVGETVPVHEQLDALGASAAVAGQDQNAG